MIPYVTPSPTARQLRILRFIGGGAQLLIVNKEATRYRITVNDIPIDHVRIATIQAMTTNGWLQLNRERARFELTSVGRDLVDVKAFVRALSSLQETT